MSLAKAAGAGQESRNNNQESRSRRSRKGVPNTIVVHVLYLELNLGREVAERTNRVSDLVDNLDRAAQEREANVSKLLSTGELIKEDSGCASQKQGLTFHLFGTSPKASGRRTLSVVCKMADVIETPHTVPRDRTRYTVEAETAWSEEI